MLPVIKLFLTEMKEIKYDAKDHPIIITTLPIISNKAIHSALEKK